MRQILIWLLFVTVSTSTEWNTPVDSYAEPNDYRSPSEYKPANEFNTPNEYKSNDEYNESDAYRTAGEYNTPKSEWDSLPFEVESVDDCTSSVVDSLAFVSQMKSLFQVIVGDVQGARCTQINFSKTNIAVGLMRSGVEAMSGDVMSAKQTLDALGDNTYTMVKGMPVIGHTVGVGHYIAGDTKTGDDIMKGATRSIPVIVGGTFGGPAGAIAAGAAYDGTVTVIDSAIHSEYKPFGIVSSGTKLVTGKISAGEAYDASFGIAMDGLSGYIAKTKANAKTIQQASPDKNQFGSNANHFREHVLSDTDSAMSVQSQSPNLSPADMSRRSSIGGLGLDKLDLNQKTISARSSWENARVNTNGPAALPVGQAELPVIQYNCAYCTVADLKKTTLTKLLDKLGRMDIDGPNMMVSKDGITNIFHDAGYTSAAAKSFPQVQVPNGQTTVPLQSSPVSNYLNTVLQPGTKEVYGLAYNHLGGGGGHVVVLKAWKTPDGVLGSRIIDFQQPVNSQLRFINGQIPAGNTHLYHLNGLPNPAGAGTSGSGLASSALPRGSTQFGNFVSVGPKLSNAGVSAAAGATRVVGAGFPASVQGMQNIQHGANPQTRQKFIPQKPTTTVAPLLKAFPSTIQPRVTTISKPSLGNTRGQATEGVNTGFPTSKKNILSGFPG